MAVSRTVDVLIKGKDMAAGAFASARAGVQSFDSGVKKLLSPLNLLKGAVAALGIASLGAVFKKATEAAIAHEKGLGRNVETLGKLREAWDFVLVTIGRAVLGLGEGSGVVDMFVNGLVRFGTWIDQNKDGIQEFVGLIGKLVGFLGLAVRGLAGLGALVTGKGLEKAAAIIQGPADTTSFDTFKRERQQIAARKAAEDRLKEIERESQKTGRALEELSELSAPAMSILGAGKELEIKPIAETMIPTIEAGTKAISEMEFAIMGVREAIDDITQNSIIAFADTWADATEEMIAGSANLGEAILRAGRRAVGGVLQAEGRRTLLKAAEAAAEGLSNPAKFLQAARLFAVGTAQTAAGALFSGGGGGGGGGGGLGAGGFAQQQREMEDGRGEATIIIEGGVLDMSDPRQADALAKALSELSGRRVVVVGGS